MPHKSKVLQRQLLKLGLNANQAPPDPETWHQFLARVSACYNEADQDRYLLERSLEISSDEMRDRFSKINLLVDQLQLNQSVLQDMLRDVGFEVTMSDLATNIEKRVTGFRCAIFRKIKDGNELEIVAAPGFAQSARVAMTVVATLPEACPCGQAAYYKTPIVYNGDSSHPQHEQLVSMGFESCYAYPVLNASNEVVAVFSLFAEKSLILSQQQSELMKGLGEIVQMAFSHADIKRTLQKEQEGVAARSKMTTLGEMAGGVAHEINNPLFILQGYVDLISTSIEDKNLNAEELLETCQSMSTAIHRIAKIVRTLRNFSRDASEDPLEPTFIEILLADALELCSKRYEGVEIELVQPEGGINEQVLCRPVEIVQVLINLLNNSYDAVKNKSERWIRIEILPSSGRVEIRVTDSGQGIEEKAKGRLFHPFVTTKPAGQGTGLGLSISKKIVEAHSGRLFYNPDHSHTQFVVDLPVYKESA